MTTHVGVIEDSELARDLLVDVLTDRGYQVTACATAAEARAAFFPTAPDLLLTDVGLPDGDGIDLLAELRRVHDELPALILSGLGGEEDLMRGFEAGASDYLTKPVQPPELLAKCAVVLERALKRSPASQVGNQLPGGNQQAFGRYRIESVLGQGGNGVVYAATDLKAHCQVALKVLTSRASLHEESRRRFIREAYTLSQVRHPHIAQVFDFGSGEGRMFLAMEHVEGTTLTEKVRAEGTASEEDLRVLMHALAGALEELGNSHLVHRDVKPGNIVLRGGRWDDPVLVDFGLARQSFDRSLTRTGQMVGTPAYMAPESIRGEPLDTRADLFSLGLVARFASCGKGVFGNLPCYELLVAILSRPVPIPSHLSGPMRSVLKRLTRIDRDQRYPSTAHLCRDLERLAVGELPLAAVS